MFERLKFWKKHRPSSIEVLLKGYRLTGHVEAHLRTKAGATVNVADVDWDGNADLGVRATGYYDVVIVQDDVDVVIRRHDEPMLEGDRIAITSARWIAFKK